MACKQFGFDVPVFEGKAVSEEKKRVVLSKSAIAHIVLDDPCAAPVSVCIKRVVKCQKGCYFEELLHDFPIDSCDPILPPGEYEFEVLQSFIPLFEGEATRVDVILEDISSDYIQAIIANKQGGCK